MQCEPRQAAYEEEPLKRFGQACELGGAGFQGITRVV